MHIKLRCGARHLRIAVPDAATIYESDYPPPADDPAGAVMGAARSPLEAPPLKEALQDRRAGPVVVVVSDITRPVPYPAFLGDLLAEVEEAGVARDDILILIATGMHRACPPAEQREMLGDAADIYRVLNHDARDEDLLMDLPARSHGGSPVRLNRHYIEAGFRLITGLVEPHFMAGFSGGRKAVCPGLTSLETIQQFHGFDFLDHPRARNGTLQGNPLHEEALSVARAAPADFSVNVVLDQNRRLVRAFAGEMEAAHEAACRFVSGCACPRVEQPADVVVTSSGGYPLDATFYQCVKGFVSCLPAVREGGGIVAFGGCSEGIGSAEYERTMVEYSGRWRRFIEDIRDGGRFVRDQWQYQMHVKALERVGQDGLHFVTDGLSASELSRLSVNPHAVQPAEVEDTVQELVDRLVGSGASLAAFPEGPYCAPVAWETDPKGPV